MRRLKVLITGMMVATIVGIVSAQKMEPEERAAKEVEHLSSIVSDVSEQQKEQLKAANLKHLQTMRNMREESMASDDASKQDKQVARQKMLALRKEKHEAYKKILTEKQFKAFKEWTANHPPKKGKKGKKEDDPS